MAVASSPHATHAVDVSAHLDRVVASLAAHRAYLAALSDEPPEQQARTFFEQVRQFRTRTRSITTTLVRGMTSVDSEFAHYMRDIMSMLCRTSPRR